MQEPVLEKNMKKLAACVGKFSHSTVSNNDLKNDTRDVPSFQQGLRAHQM